MNTKIMRRTCIFEQNSLQISKLTISKLQNHFADFILPIPIPFKMIFQTSVCKFFKHFKHHFSDILFQMSIFKIIFQIAFSKYIHTFFFQISNFRFLFQVFIFKFLSNIHQFYFSKFHFSSIFINFHIYSQFSNNSTYFQQILTPTFLH